MEEPEIIKMLKYILLISSVIFCAQCHPLVTEQPSIVPVPIHHSGEDYSSVVPSLISDSGHKISTSDSISQGIIKDDEEERQLRREISMSPVENIKDIQDDMESNNSGGHKRVRQVPPEGGPQLEDAPNGSPPPSDELCSLFQFFLESRRYSRCRVSNTENDRYNEGISGPPPPPRGTIKSGHRFDFNSNFHRQVSNEVAPSSDLSSGDNFQSESETREIENERQRSIIHELPSRMGLGDPNRMEDREPSASKRYDQLEDLHIHGGRPGPEDHLIIPPPPPGPPPMFPKSSLDRTTIIVPERPCPRGERRDHKGYCRRIVRVSRPNYYQYGPPPPPYGPSRPIRYYYSRFVSVPTLQFFIPAVS